MNEQHERQYQLWGWYLFLASAGFFLAASLLSGDWVTLGGSLFFLLGCILFLIPLWFGDSKR
jgi:hypothetical protein